MRFRNAAPFVTRRNRGVMVEALRCQRNPAKISRDAALAQRRPTVVSASAQCLGDPQRHGRDLRKKMNVMKKPTPSKAEERQPRRLPGFISEMEVDWPMPSCVRPLQLGSGRATDAEAVPQCSWNGSAALGRPDRLWDLIGKLCRYEITENSSTYPGIAILDCANLGDRKGCADLQAFRSSKIAFQISRSIRIQPDLSDQT